MPTYLVYLFSGFCANLLGIFLFNVPQGLTVIAIVWAWETLHGPRELTGLLIQTWFYATFAIYYGLSAWFVFKVSKSAKLRRNEAAICMAAGCILALGSNAIGCSSDGFLLASTLKGLYAWLAIVVQLAVALIIVSRTQTDQTT